MRPSSVQAFEVVAWIAVGVLVLILLISFIQLSQFGSRVFRGGIVFGLLLTLVLAIGLGITAYFAARRRSNAARWAYVSMAGLAVGLTVLGMASGRVGRAGGIAQLRVVDSMGVSYPLTVNSC